jgi:hypothetical protein
MARCCSSWWAEVANDLEIRQRDMSHEMHCRQ